jgi:hypothetical protein
VPGFQWNRGWSRINAEFVISTARIGLKPSRREYLLRYTVYNYLTHQRVHLGRSGAAGRDQADRELEACSLIPLTVCGGGIYPVVDGEGTVTPATALGGVF